MGSNERWALPQSERPLFFKPESKQLLNPKSIFLQVCLMIFEEEDDDCGCDEDCDCEDCEEE